MSKGKKSGTVALTVSELRQDLPNVMNRVFLLGESFVVMKYGKEVGVLSPINNPEDLERIRAKIGDGAEDNELSYGATGRRRTDQNL